MGVEDFFSSVVRVFCSPLVLICAALLIIDHGRVAGPSLRAIRAAVYNVAYDTRAGSTLYHSSANRAGLSRVSLVQVASRPEVTLRDDYSYSGGGIDLLGISSARNWMQQSILVLRE